MRRKPAMVDFVRGMDRAGKPVAAICHAGWMLVSAGIVKGRRATGFFSIKDDLVAAGARYVDEAVVGDRNPITPGGPQELPVFPPPIIQTLGRARAGVRSTRPA